MIRLVLSVIVLSLCLPSCAAVRAKRTENFMTSVRTYNEGVRWQRYTHAARHLSAAERNSFLEERHDLDDDMRISGWEILRVDYQDAERRGADVHVRYTWHLDSEGIVRETTAVQTWELRGKRWLLADEVRVRGPAMPGVGEPVEASGPEKPLSAR